MNKFEFMNQLEALLSELPDSEKKEALQYYEDYFNDAGVESEQEVLESLGSPEKIAQTIKSELGVTSKRFDSDKIECRENANRNTENAYQGSDGVNATGQNPGNGTAQKSGLSAGVIALIIVLCILASPILIGVGVAVISLVFSVIVTLFSLILAFGLISICLFVAAVLYVAVGIAKLFAAPLGGLVLIGIGMLSGGFALLFLLLTIWLTVTVTPALFKGLAWLCTAPFKKHA